MGVVENEATQPRARISRPHYHGRGADFQPGNVLRPGYPSNLGERRKANFVW